MATGYTTRPAQRLDPAQSPASAVSSCATGRGWRVPPPARRDRGNRGSCRPAASRPSLSHGVDALARRDAPSTVEVLQAMAKAKCWWPLPSWGGMKPPPTGIGSGVPPRLKRIRTLPGPASKAQMRSSATMPGSRRCARRRRGSPPRPRRRDRSQERRLPAAASCRLRLSSLHASDGSAARFQWQFCGRPRLGDRAAKTSAQNGGSGALWRRRRPAALSTSRARRGRCRTCGPASMAGRRPC